MTKVWVVEGDNNSDYSDHHNWFITVADSVASAEDFILKNKTTSLYYGSEYNPETEHPIPQENSDKHLVWNFSDEGFSWHKVIIYIYEVKVYAKK